MKLDEIKKTKVNLTTKQAKEFLLMVVKYARLKKREQITGFKG